MPFGLAVGYDVACVVGTASVVASFGWPLGDAPLVTVAPRAAATVADADAPLAPLAGCY